MLLASVLLASTVALGVGLAGFIESRHRLLLSVPLGVLGFTWISWVLSSVFGFNEGSILATCVIALAYGGLAYLKKPWKLAVDRDVGFFACVMLALFGFLHFSLLYFDNDGGLKGFSTDFNFHSALLTTVANGNFPPQWPFYLSDVKLSYYFFPHFYAAHYAKAGFDVVSSFGVFIAMAAVFCTLMYALAKTLTNSKKASVLVVLAFLFFSSLAFLPYFAENLPRTTNLPDFAVKPNVGIYSLTYQQGYPVINNLVQFLLTQRSMAFGLAFGIVALLILLEGGFSKRALAAAGIVLGLSLPFHVIVTLALFAVVATYLTFYHRKKEAAWFFVPSVVLFAASFAMLFAEKPVSQSVQLAPGWMALDKSLIGIAWFWASNLVFFVLLAAFYWKKQPESLRRLVIASVPLVVVLNVITFTPNPWDSGKILLPALILLSIATGNGLKELLANKRVLAVLFIILACFFSLMLLKTTLDARSFTIYGAGEVNACEFVKSLPENAFFLTSQSHNCIGAIAGRKVFAGEPLHLKNNFLDSSLAESENKRMLEGDCTAIKKWGITHFYDGGMFYLPGEVNYSFFNAHGKRLWTDNRTSVYRVDC